MIRGVDWAFYERLADSIPEGVNIHADFDGRDLELMSLSPLHDGIKKRLGRFVELTAEELEIPCTGLGQTTWKRPELARGRVRGHEANVLGRGRVSQPRSGHRS